MISDLQYRGKEVIKGDEFAASKNFKVNQKTNETAKKWTSFSMIKFVC